MSMLQTLFTLLALARPVVAPAPQLAAGELLGKMQQYYVDTKKLKADFRQEYTNTTFGKTSVSDGKVMIAKPGRMRWDYEKPERKYFISDGKKLWAIEEASKQAIEQSLEDQILPVAVTFLLGTGDLTSEFTPALDPGKYGAKGDYVLKLTPKKPEAQYKNLWLVIDPTDFHVKESIILEATDNLNHFTFANLKQNDAAKFEDKHFVVSPQDLKGKGFRIVKPQAPAQPGGGNVPE